MYLKENLSIEEKTLSRLLNAQEVAGALNMGLSTVYMLVEQGGAPQHPNRALCPNST